jgi:hypothetical protein
VAYISCEGSVSLQTKLISTSSQAPKYLGGIFVTDKEDGTGTGFIFGPAKNTTINGGLMVSNLTGTTFFSNATVQPFPLFLRVTSAYKNFCFEYSADGTTWNTAFTTTDSSIATGARFFAGITAFSLEGTYYTSMVFDRFEKSPYLGPR